MLETESDSELTYELLNNELVWIIWRGSSLIVLSRPKCGKADDGANDGRFQATREILGIMVLKKKLST